MSKYTFVEKPFLDQLDALDWTVIDQGPGIPTDPTKSLRENFREVTLRDVFNQAVRTINTTPDGRTWPTDKQLDDLHDDLFEAEPRIKEIASDLVTHYIANILPNGFKAMVVCSSKLVEVRRGSNA